MEEFNGEGFAANIGLRCLIDGTVPPSAGLSSSSALVVSAAICEMKLMFSVIIWYNDNCSQVLRGPSISP